MIAEAWHFGAPVAGYRWRPIGEPRATLLLAHGYAEYAERYVARYHGLVPALVGRGFDVHAFDYAGHGGSAGRRGAADVEAAVAQHRQARRALAGQKPLFLFGHSLGGLVTAASVARDGAGVAGVVLSAPLLLVEAPPLLRLIGRVLAKIAPGAGVQPPLDPAGISRIDAEVEAYCADPRGYHGKLPAILGASALKVAAASWPLYPAWTAPVLALHGTADTFTNPEGSERFIAAVAASDKRLELFEDGRHELLNDLERDRALALVLDWLEQRVSAGGPPWPSRVFGPG